MMPSPIAVERGTIPTPPRAGAKMVGLSRRLGTNTLRLQRIPIAWCIRHVFLAVYFFALANGVVACSKDDAGAKQVVLASATSVQESGVLDVLVSAFEDETEYDVKIISSGSGKAVESVDGVDALLLNSPETEKHMIADGTGIDRALVMHSDFVLVGPKTDPAGVRETADIDSAMRAIASTGALFVSRSDDPGTHDVERVIWAALGIEPDGEEWYGELGPGQGAALHFASRQAAYAIIDRGTFLAQRANLSLDIVSEKSLLLNYYHIVVVNPEEHPGVNVAGARAWAMWIVGDEAQHIIQEFGVDRYGESLFTADAGKPDPTK